MKNDIMQRLFAVINALNNVSVSGKQNLSNLSGSLSVLEELTNIIKDCDITKSSDNKKEETKT